MFMLLCLKKVSILAASCAPPSNPLSPSWTLFLPIPTPTSVSGAPEGLMSTAEGYVLSSRTRQQASVSAVPLHLYNLCLFISLFSIDCGLICTGASLPDCAQITLNLVLNLIALCEMFVRLHDLVWNVVGVSCLLLAQPLLSCWLHTSITSSQFLPEEQPATWSIGYV